ncbi:hypothetical protein PP940_gp256 [Rhizobium phage RL2RES]|uniref:Uncharacterized protein n=1 Tax=Rhizobium phage RL2RES TaxID=103371 RepID=A0A6B9J6F6_9CAUD|nr:hypothetical protein PP940_gp256 [Rhizobium phage RL2RES]QGZ14355.1 hypothetical protein RL2RES_256 [Rhizobium phage RL2RES]
MTQEKVEIDLILMKIFMRMRPFLYLKALEETTGISMDEERKRLQEEQKKDETLWT